LDAINRGLTALVTGINMFKFHNITVFTEFLIKYIQPWWAEEISLKSMNP